MTKSGIEVDAAVKWEENDTVVLDSMASRFLVPKMRGRFMRRMLDR